LGRCQVTFKTALTIKHGLEPGYYLAFITGGIYVSLGRQLRRFVRPYVLPSATPTGDSPNSFPKYPYPNLAKRVYDVFGWLMVQINLNYTASAFLLLGFKDCLRAWNRMYWHGHLIIIATSLFFHFGGRQTLRKNLPEVPKKSVPSINIAPPSPIDGISSPPQDERDPTDLSWVKHALDNPSYKDAGKGTHPGDMVDRAIEYSDTPRTDLSRSMSPN
jgi:lysophospholipid acyltransferase